MIVVGSYPGQMTRVGAFLQLRRSSGEEVQKIHWFCKIAVPYEDKRFRIEDP